VVDPADYAAIVSELKAHAGSTTLALRFRLAGKAFEHTAAYDRAIADFLGGVAPAEIGKCYKIQKS
jgi:phosphoribosylaminoimidazolecarboxamide formyltransferase/IMP cyclohydrolase